MLSAAITPKRGVMRHLEDDTARGFRNTAPHTHTHTFYPFIEKQLGDKQSGRVRDGAGETEKERERKN